MNTLSSMPQTSVAGALSANPAMDPKTQRLDKAAHQFEAMLLQEMLKPLAQHNDIDGNKESDGGGSGPMEGFGIEAIAGSLARSNALGFAYRIESALQHASVAKSAKDVPLSSEKI